jgi:acetolactate synthase-1/2/3 large subunit
VSEEVSEQPSGMQGGEALLRTLVASGVDACFANPGTTEMHLVAALDRVPEMRAVLGLFEGVCTGAADGFARVTGRPAMTLLHLGPGFANGIANLHNARRAASPVVNVVGDHASWHLDADAPLTSDIESLARPMSTWVGTARRVEDVATLGARAVAAACAPVGGPATLIVSQDATWSTGARPAAPIAPDREADATESDVAAAADVLHAGGVLLLGGRALRAPSLRNAARVAAGTGCRVLLPMFPARQERGLGLPAFDRLPYFPEQASAALDGPGAVLAGAPEPVAFFGYPAGRSRLVADDARVVALAPPGVDAPGAVAALADLVGADPSRELRAPVEPPTGDLGVGALGDAVAATLPADAVVVEEAATSGLGFAVAAAGAARHVSLHLTGGAIGQGLPNAVGAAVGAPGRRVVALQADGSGMYTLQALWTMARESFDVTVVVCANRAYRILQVEYMRAAESPPRAVAESLMRLDEPALDWCSLAAGLGVPACAVETADDLVTALRASFADAGPALIEARLS